MASMLYLFTVKLGLSVGRFSMLTQYHHPSKSLALLPIRHNRGIAYINPDSLARLKLLGFDLIFQLSGNQTQHIFATTK